MSPPSWTQPLNLYGESSRILSLLSPLPSSLPELSIRTFTEASHPQLPFPLISPFWTQHWSSYEDSPRSFSFSLTLTLLKKKKKIRRIAQLTLYIFMNSTKLADIIWVGDLRAFCIQHQLPLQAVQFISFASWPANFLTRSKDTETLPNHHHQGHRTNYPRECAPPPQLPPKPSHI